MLNRVVIRGFSTLSEGPIHQDLKQAMIKASLLHVNKFGWNQKAIQAGCNDLNLSSASHGILQNGAYDLVDYMMREWNRKTLVELRERDLESLKVRDRIKLGIKMRLQHQIPYINTWNEAMALGILPSNCSTTTSNLWRIADDIWFLSGDRSTDYNYYTKRTLLLGIYASTELFMLTDKSKEFVETWNFLDRRIDEVLSFGFSLHNFKNFTYATGKGLLDMTTMFKNFPNKIENDISEIKRKFSENKDDINNNNIRQ